MSKAGNRKKLTATVCAASIALFFVAAIGPVSAQAPVPPPNKASKAAQQGGNSFLAPRDIIYVPTRPVSDTLADMYFGDWRNSEPKVMFGSLIVRDILTRGDNFGPPFPGAVLQYAKFLSYGQLEPGAQTVPTTMQGLQVFFYVSDGQGEVSAGGRTESLHKGSALLVPEGLEFTLPTIPATTELTSTLTWSAIQPIQDSNLVRPSRSKTKIRSGADLTMRLRFHPLPIQERPLTGPTSRLASSAKRTAWPPSDTSAPWQSFPCRWVSRTRTIPAMKRSLVCGLRARVSRFTGSSALRIQQPGQAFMLRPDNVTTHSNINFEEPGDKPVNFLWIAEGMKTASH